MPGKMGADDRAKFKRLIKAILVTLNCGLNNQTPEAAKLTVSRADDSGVIDELLDAFEDSEDD